MDSYLNYNIIPASLKTKFQSYTLALPSTAKVYVIRQYIPGLCYKVPGDPTAPYYVIRRLGWSWMQVYAEGQHQTNAGRVGFYADGDYLKQLASPAAQNFDFQVTAVAKVYSGNVLEASRSFLPRQGSWCGSRPSIRP